jgi:hypothetical protein
MKKFERDLLPSRYPDTPLHPVNKQAALLLSSAKEGHEGWGDSADNIDPDALEFASALKKSSVFKPFSLLRAAKVIAPLLKRRTVVEKTLSPDLMELEKMKLAQSQEHIRLAKERAINERVRIQAKLEADKLNHSRQHVFLQAFKDAAQSVLQTSDYALILDLALNTVNESSSQR